MAGPVSLGIRLAEGRAARFGEVRTRMRDLSPAGPAVVAAMREGDGSVADQFDREAEMTLSGQTIRWRRTKPFGRRPPPAKTLQSSGSYRAAWLGRGAGAVTRIEPFRFVIGADPQVFPQVRVFQRDRPTVVRARRRTVTGKLAMQLYLGFTYGVWISERKLLAGLVNHPRRVAVSGAMVDRVQTVILRYLATGQARRGSQEVAA